MATTDIKRNIEPKIFAIKSKNLSGYIKNSKKLAVVKNIKNIPTICDAVLTFPQYDAGITFPFLVLATSLYPDTANSLVKTTIGIQYGILVKLNNITIAAKTNILSANGSKNLPKSVI